MHDGAFVRENRSIARVVAVVDTQVERREVFSACTRIVRYVYVRQQKRFARPKMIPLRVSQKVGRLGAEVVCVSVTPVHGGCIHTESAAPAVCHDERSAPCSAQAVSPQRR